MNRTMSKRDYIAFASALLAAITGVFYLIRNGMGRAEENTQIVTAILLIAAAILEVSAVFVKGDLLPALPSVLLGTVLGILLYWGIPTVTDHLRSVNFFGGYFDYVVLFIGLTLVSSVLSSIYSFSAKKK